MSDACAKGCGRVFRGDSSMENAERHEVKCDGKVKPTRRSRGVHATVPKILETARQDSVAAALRCLKRWRDSLPADKQGAYFLGVTKALEVADALDDGQLGDLIATITKDGLS